MTLVHKDIQKKQNEERGIKAATEHTHDNFYKIRRRMSKYKGRYRRYD